jgi:hypothetical protein
MELRERSFGYFKIVQVKENFNILQRTFSNPHMRLLNINTELMSVKFDVKKEVLWENPAALLRTWKN